MEETNETVEEEMTVEDGMIAGLTRFIMTLIKNAIEAVKEWVTYTYDERIDDVDSKVVDLENIVTSLVDEPADVSTEQMNMAISDALDNFAESWDLERWVTQSNHAQEVLQEIATVLQNNGY